MKNLYYLSVRHIINRFSLLIIVLTFSSSYAYCNTGGLYGINETQQQKTVVKGFVRDKYGDPLPGVTIMQKDRPTHATITDADGAYELKDVPPESILVYSFIGMKKAEVPVNYQTLIDVSLEEDAIAMEQVVVVAFGKQKKESMVSSITSISPKELKVPSSNLSTALAGRLAGVIAYQRSGEPGADNASYFIRGVTTFGYKKDPLILIDGIESSSTALSRLQPDDIESFSILKDAAATALYGARGANGVIQVATKEGKEGPLQVSIRFENSFSSNTKDIELADPITFMEMANEATSTRNPLSSLPYSYEKIARTSMGLNPYVYPANDWRKMLMKDVTYNPRLNLNISGGGAIARYYIAATYNKDKGNLKMDKRNNFNNNINLDTYQIRSNVSLDLTKTTVGTVRFSGTFDDYNGPVSGGRGMYEKIMQSNPIAFPAYYPSDLMPNANHILFGNAQRGVEGGGSSASYTNPYAELVKGYSDYRKAQIDATIELKQDLHFLTKGLNARMMFNTSRYSYYANKREYKPYFYTYSSFDKLNNSYTITQINEKDNPTEYLDFSETGRDISSTVYIEGALNYNRQFNKLHEVGGTLVYQQREELKTLGDNSFELTLPYRNQGLSGRFTYAFSNRYMAEFNFGYNGSERFYKSKRFGFFPAGGVGWTVSNENFWEKLNPIVSKLKLKMTYGLVGNDAIGRDEDRFFYMSNVDMNVGWKGYNFGANYDYSKNGIAVLRYGNEDIGWEKAYKTNWGLELGLFNDLEIQVDYFTEKRTNILMDRIIPAEVGFVSDIKANVGEAKAHGVDLSVDYNKIFSNGYWIQARGNFTYAHNEYLKYEEPKYREGYRSKIGYSIDQQWGLVAERLFIDEYDVQNSPKQTYGEYGPGDIKYIDMNNDGIINDADEVPIGYPKVPEIIYGFGFSVGNNRVDLSAFFQGSARSSFWIDGTNTSPFQNDVPLLKAYADNHWSESNRDIYALWPRLSPVIVANNTQKYSTWFMRNGAFLRLKSVEVGYTLSEKILRRYGVKSLRTYFSGTNLLLFSGFKLWDIEMGGDGIGYPIQRVLNVGVQINF